MMLFTGLSRRGVALPMKRMPTIGWAQVVLLLVHKSL